MQGNAQQFDKLFFQTDLRFSLPFRNVMPYIEIMKFNQKFWSLLLTLLGDGVFGEEKMF